MQKYFFSGVTFLLLLFAAPVRAVSDEPLTPVTLQLQWQHQFQFAGFYAAIEKGYYRNAGFQVTLREWQPGMDPVAEVIEGRADYGVAGSQLVYYKVHGVPVTVLATLVQHSPMAIITLADSGLNSPSDLVGKRIMFSEGAYGVTTLSILAREGVKPNQIEQISPSYDFDDLIEGRVDAVTGYATIQPYRLLKRGIRTSLIYPRTYGVDFYGDTLFTMQHRVFSRPDEVRRFREATLQGWRYAVQHPEEIIDLILEKYSSKYERDILEYEAEETLKHIVPELVEIGHMNVGRWKHIAETYAELGMAPVHYDLDGFVYNPDARPDDSTLQKLLWGLAVACVLGAIGIFFLGLFNWRLRRAVDRKTNQLVKANDALFRHTQNLVEKERALFRLNQELEQKVQERTRELAKINLDLQHEIDERAQRELSLMLLSNAVDNSRSGIVVTDSAGIILYVNAAFLGVVGLEQAQVKGKHVSALRPKIQLPECGPNVLGRAPQNAERNEIECLGPNNQRLWIQVSMSAIRNEQGNTTHYVLACEDITELKRSKDDMERLAYYDSLTGLENRVLFRLRMDKALAQAERERIKTALMFIDIDHFKQINDTFGHDAGDEVLKTVAARIRQNIRTNDTVARISGDEFTVLLSSIHSNDDVRKVAQSILKTLARPIKLIGNEYFVSASIGIAIIPDDGTAIDELMKNADMAMYEAKRNGRNNFQFFSHRLNEEAMRNLDLEQELKVALAEQDFFMVYQPRICLKTMELAGVEALIRWGHSDKGVVYPDYFMAFAEESGFIVELGRWVLSECMTAADIMQEAGLGKNRLSVNISGRQIRDRGLLNDIISIFGQRNDLINAIELELAETSLIENNRESIQTVHDLGRMGFRLALDDFGTGYSSLSCLQRFPVEHVKIDKSFVQDLQNQRSVETVRAVIAMAHSLNIKVVAEGVETEEQLQFLREAGCDFVQGFYLGKAMSLQELISQYKLAEAECIQA